MGTNYHARFNVCECCDRYDDVHIGKSMSTFRAYPKPAEWDSLPAGLTEPIESWSDWFKLLEDGTVPIFDEYDREVAVGADRADWLAQWTPHPDGVPGWFDEWGAQFDIDGHRFWPTEFS